MKQPLFISNIAIDEKRISFIEKVVSRLARRSRSVAKVMISPIPISTCALGEDISGTIMKSILFKGKLSDIAVQLNERPKGLIGLKVEVDNLGNSFYINKAKHVFPLALESIDGSTLKISISNEDSEYKITEVLVSVLWIPSIQNIEIKSFLIDELEKTVVDLLE